jgi:acetyltransferase-like isoleucine patch superfamily enzyme
MRSQSVAPQDPRLGSPVSDIRRLQPVAVAGPAPTRFATRARGAISHMLAAAGCVHVKYHLANAVAGMLPDFASGPVRTRLYRWAGFRHIQTGSSIAGNMTLVGERLYERLIIGYGGIIAYDVTMSLDSTVTIGNRVSIGPGVKIFTGTHTLGPGSNRRHHKLISMAVSIEDGCWIGLGSIILPGVTIGRGSVVSAGAIVTESVPPNSYVAGNPARVVRSLPWGDR